MTTPTFASRRSHAFIRAFAVIGLCSALTAGFLSETWSAPRPEQVASSHAGHVTTRG